MVVPSGLGSLCPSSDVWVVYKEQKTLDNGIRTRVTFFSKRYTRCLPLSSLFYILKLYFSFFKSPLNISFWKEFIINNDYISQVNLCPDQNTEAFRPMESTVEEN